MDTEGRVYLKLNLAEQIYHLFTIFGGLVKARLITSVVLAGAVALGTTGCGFFVPVETKYEYAPSDGVNLNAGDVRVRNALFIVNEDATAFNLTMSTINTTNKASKLNITAVIDGKRTEKSIIVEPGATQYGNPEKGQETLVFADLGAKAGQTIQVFFQSGSSDEVEQYVPVLDGTLAEYAPLVVD